MVNIFGMLNCFNISRPDNGASGILASLGKGLMISYSEPNQDLIFQIHILNSFEIAFLCLHIRVFSGDGR